MKKLYTVEVRQTITVKADLDNFTDKFMKEFRETMYNFTSIEDHIRHLATLYAGGFIAYKNDYVEGYGRLEGVEFNEEDTEVEIISEEEVYFDVG